ncbi:MAG TPA: hypothetical protein ENH29_06240, partial [Bacteroidetes bacterium]|nr:hypothetical protein [Bacteroidota bacterium]
MKKIKTTGLSSIAACLLLFLSLYTTGFADEKWSSLQPLSIPFKVRKQQFDKGNIVPDFSFERGTVRSTDSLITDFSLASWSVVGKNVQWTDKNHKGYSGADIATGRHAVKIIRKNPNETDAIGGGVKSDFIPVIPGNYLFTYDVKLKNVQSN